MTAPPPPPRGRIVRDPIVAAGEPFELIVVGGGVYGVSVALEGAARGLRTLVLERADFGAETSAATLRILHGGFRYLQSFDIPRLRESVKERRWWARTFPALVSPLPCLLPLYGDGARRREFLAPALLLNDLLSIDRNRGVEPRIRIPSSRTLGRRETIRLFPGVRKEGLRGSALWTDASMESAHRLLLEMVRWVTGAGSTALNYVEVVGLLQSEGRIAGVRAIDRVDGSELEFRAPLVVNAGGPWAPEVARHGGIDGSGLFRPSLAFNLLLRRPLPIEFAVGISAPGKPTQTYFLRPRGPMTFVGTGHVPWPRSAGGPPAQLPDAIIKSFLGEIRRAVPSFEVTSADLVREIFGLLPALHEGSATTVRRPVILDHSRSGGPTGLFSLSGVKFTTAPDIARRVLDRATGKGTRERDAFMANPPTAPPWMAPHEFRELRRTSPERAATLLRSIVADEAVVYQEDLLLRRLDWGLDLEDPIVAGSELTDLEDGPSLPRRPISAGGGSL